MNKKVKELIDKLHKRENISFGGTFTIKNSKTQTRNKSNNLEFAEIQLMISTDSPSPIQTDPWWEIKWNEIISSSAFDSALENDLFSFLDHKMDIEHTIASTKNKTMTFEKSNSGYISTIKLDLSDPKSEKLYKSIQNGIVSENSFIFIPEEVEYRENQISNTDEAELTVIHKKGTLISVDPVIMAFYPQNEVTINSEQRNKEKIKEFNMNEKELEQKQKELEQKQKDLEQKEKDLKEQESTLREKIKKEDEEDHNDDPNKESTKTPDPTKDENDEEEAEEDEEDEVDEKSKTSEEESRKVDFEKLKIRNQILKQKLQMSKEKYKMDTKISFKQIEKEFISRSTKPSLGNEFRGISDEEKKFLDDKFADLARNNPKMEKEIELSATGTMTRSIDGSTYSNGLAFISYINDPEVKTQLEKVFPEIQGADFIALDTLDIVKKDLIIPSDTALTPIAEGVESTLISGKTVSVEFEPTRYSTQKMVNFKLDNYANILEKETINTKSSIVTSLRSAFYTNLVQHVDVNFSTLGDGAYKGGITKDALISSSNTNALALQDLDGVINTIESTYGEDAKNLFVIMMHPNTRTYIASLARELFNGSWVMNEENNTYRGVKFITAPMFPYKVNEVTGAPITAGKPVLIFARKDTIAVRGFSFVIEDNPWINQSKGLLTRYQSTRGQAKLYDPYLNVKAIAVGAISYSADGRTQKVITKTQNELNQLEEDLSKTDINNKNYNSLLETIEKTKQKLAELKNLK